MATYYRKPNSDEIVNEFGNFVTKANDPENYTFGIKDANSLPIYGAQNNGVPIRQARTTDSLSLLKQKLATELTGQPDTINDRNAITNLMNARIKEIESRIAQRVQAEQETGRRTEAQAGAINIRAGLAGSDFATARTEGVKTKTKEAISAIQEQGQAEKNTIYAQQEVALQNIEDRALQRQQQRLGLLQKGVELVEGEQTKALTDFTVLAKAGNDWSKIESTPGLLDELQAQTGKSADFLKFTYLANLPQDEYTAPNYHWENGNLVAINFDKKTGKVSTQTFSASELGIPEGTDIKVLPADDFGNVYWYDAKELASGNTKLNKLGTVGVKPTGGNGAETDALVNTILENPELFNQLTPTEKAKVAPALNKLGFTAFGKPLSDTAIKEITATETALGGVSDLIETVKANEKYIGPISGFQSLNPYSKAKQVQADIDRIKQRVGKALEGGVLRKEDEEKYKKILATVFDTPETALYKLNQLSTDLQREIDTYKKNQMLSGRNIQNENNQTDNMTDEEAYQEYLKAQQK